MIEHAGLVYRITAPAGGVDDRLVYLGDDGGGVALEVMAVECDDGGIHVIHAMPLRSTYRRHYEEAQRWRV